MKYLYSWLKEYHNFKQTPEELAKIIVSLGTEVESIKSFPVIDDKIIVAKILEVKDHPNADRLHIAKITTGKEELEVVCGAPNLEEGQLVPFAQVGTTIDGIKVKEVEIRGVRSPGMLCSEKELDLGDNHEGIKILENVEVGEKASKYLAKGTVLEAEVTPNRGDLLSHIGLSRDLAAYFKKPLDSPKIQLKESNQKASDEISVQIESDKCSLYCARVIKGLKIGPSPDWLKEKLSALGAKPINNVVDVTNFVMLDLGQPLHAFDAKKIKDKKIVVREIDRELDVETLDGVKRALLPGMLAICDGKTPIAVAGVMGLGNSEIDNQTTDIVLESAVFDRKSIRKTAKLLSLNSEASYRFERGIDAGSTELALDRAAKMIQEIAGGEILTGVVKSGEFVRHDPVKLDYELINSLSGVKFEKNDVDAVLHCLGFKIESEKVIVPTWRHDIHDKEDLVEEVVRMVGLDKIKQEPLKDEKTPALSDYFKKEKIKDLLADDGLTEVLNYAFLSDTDVVAAKIDPKDLVEVSNPVQEENKYLRNSLIPLMLKNIAKNPSFDDIEIFEVGQIFNKDAEQTSLAIVTSGRSARKANNIVQKLCETLDINEKDFNLYDIARDELNRFKIKKPSVSVAEATLCVQSGVPHSVAEGVASDGINLETLLPKAKFGNLDFATKNDDSTYQRISKFPPVKRDLAFVVDQSSRLDEIKNEILKTSAKTFLVEAFDEFIDKRFGDNKKSVAFHIWLQDLDKTLSDSEADSEISKIIDALKQKFSADLRS